MIKMKVDKAKLVELARRVADELKPKVADVGGLRGLAGMKTCAGWVVRAVERVGLEAGLLGEDKQQVAVQAILDLVPDRWVPDWLIEPLVRWIVDRAVVSVRTDAAKG
ncbi:MAG: hypothetical protein PHS14_02965 [Elusimicrobia bacterium]|nr:hypothetical protein [Elusimicrobiota bacterium]